MGPWRVGQVFLVKERKNTVHSENYTAPDFGARFHRGWSRSFEKERKLNWQSEISFLNMALKAEAAILYMGHSKWIEVERP